MRSSTSSSEAAEAPEKPIADAAATGSWRRIWTRALLVAFVGVAALEGGLRGVGFRPIVRDDAATWALARRRVEPDSVVLAGSSRVQAGIDLDTWAAMWGGAQPIQLAIAGGTPLPVVEELAADGQFRGVVVADVPPHLVFSASPRAEQDVAAMLAEHRAARVSPSRRSEAWLRTRVSERFVAWSMPPDQLFDRVRRSDGPRVPYFTLDANRALRLDFTKIDLARQIRNLGEEVESRGGGVDDAARDARIARFERAEATLLARGGRVVWLQMPTGGTEAAIESELFPDARYWDVLVARLRGVVIDAERVPALAGFRCPDGSHLDVRERATFTSALVRELRSRLAARERR